MKTEKYQRKTFVVEAVRVTQDNLEEVARWCNGEVARAAYQNKSYIKVDVANPLNERQTQAFPGDWVLFTNGYKVYKDRAFQLHFEPVMQPVVVNQFFSGLAAKTTEMGRDAAL